MTDKQFPEKQFKMERQVPKEPVPPAVIEHGGEVYRSGVTTKHYEHGTNVSITGLESKEERYKKLELMAREYTQGSLLRRKAFVMEYVVDFHATNACLRSGNAKNRSTAGVRASKMLNEAYCQLLIRMYLDELSEDALVTRNMVLTGLLKEANEHGEDSSHAARVAAWAKLGKYIGMDIDRSMAINLSAQGPKDIPKETQEEFMRKFLGKY